MSTHDAAGALAALARLEAGSIAVGDVRRFLADPDPEWRAVGTRSLVRDADRDARQRALLDASPAVRRQAARACRDAADPRDLEGLAEAARVDPEPLVRTEAVRSLASLPAGPAADVATKLRDLWTGGDEGLREDIARAWAAPSLWTAGGRDALRVVLASKHGPAVVEGAAAVLRRKDADAEVVLLATGVMARAIEGSPRRTRLQALAEAPLEADHGSLRTVVQKAATDDDLEVRVSALSRLAEAGESDAVAKLEVQAQPGAPAAARARFALAEAGDRRVQLWLEQDLSSEAPETRLAAGTALAAMGVAARAAPLLADADVTVRLRAACTLVGAVRLGR
jgi:HEAT repeat protein